MVSRECNVRSMCNTSQLVFGKSWSGSITTSVWLSKAVCNVITFVNFAIQLVLYAIFWLTNEVIHTSLLLFCISHWWFKNSLNHLHLLMVVCLKTSIWPGCYSLKDFLNFIMLNSVFPICGLFVGFIYSKVCNEALHLLRINIYSG